MRIVLPILATFALCACGGEAAPVSAEAPPPAATAAVDELVSKEDPYALPPTPGEAGAAQPPPTALTGR